MTDPDARFIPSQEDVKAAWLASRSANHMEKIEYDIGFDMWLENIRSMAWAEGYAACNDEMYY